MRYVQYMGEGAILPGCWAGVALLLAKCCHKTAVRHICAAGEDSGLVQGVTLTRDNDTDAL